MTGVRPCFPATLLSMSCSNPIRRTHCGHTGNAAKGISSLPVARRNIIRILGGAMPPAQEATSWLPGDFNFVHNREDRWNRVRGTFSEDTHPVENAAWKQSLEQPKQLYELEQPFPTHNTTTVRSKLDRIYTNQHIPSQLIAHTTCAAL